MNPILARFDGEAALVAPEFQARFQACLAAVASSEHRNELFGTYAAADDGFWPEPGSWKASLRPYVVRDGVLQIPVKGVLLNDFPWAFGSFATGYAYIRRALERGLADPEVRGIALVCDSPGGMVAGNFDLSDRIFAARETKPIRAFAHEGAYSAAYSLASAAERVIVSRSGGVGSIGVVAMHRDLSKALDDAGIRITLIFAGAHKVDGNPFEPLPEAVRQRFQVRVEATYAELVEIVARNRALPSEAIRKTEALSYTARESVAVGLADAIGTLEDAVAEFAATLLPPEEEDEDTMATIDQATHDAALAQARQEGAAEARREGMRAANERAQAILGSEHANGREGLARHLAFGTEMPAEQAIAALEHAPEGATTTPNSSRLDALVPDPNVRADNAPGPETEAAGLGAAVDRMVAGMNPGR